ncbi:MAG TPA: hypothetical protein DCY12_06895 [Candidatus Atribacteria bacterium]|jgi:hypothetical protein|nr:hypothetical protein [Candidatus Atribacteria bacterium]
MNKLNYASYPASNKLVDAGIILETYVYWARDEKGWYLRIPDTYFREVLESIPAPSMAEILIELPTITSIHKIDGHYTGYKVEYVPSHLRSDNIQFATYNTNPIDALIDLLIWKRKEESKMGEIASEEKQ